MTGDVVQFTLNGNQVQAPAGGSLLDALRESLGVRSVKDGCSPQGQCGCCTVWIDGQPRVACVTQVGRVAGREVTTIEGLPSAPVWAATLRRARWQSVRVLHAWDRDACRRARRAPPDAAR